jgi:hypothetical protein
MLWHRTKLARNVLELIVGSTVGLLLLWLGLGISHWLELSKWAAGESSI